MESKMMSKYVTQDAAFASNTALKNHIDNHPSGPQVYKNICNFCVAIIDPIIEHYGIEKIGWSCMYRNSIVNQLVGGSSTSDHMATDDADDNAAADIYGKNGLTNEDLFAWIRQSNLKWDQLINEKPFLVTVNGKTVKRPSWIHISGGGVRLRKQVLEFTNGKYITI